VELGSGQALDEGAVTTAGAPAPIHNYQLYIALTACIAWQGTLVPPS
jgi:microcystin-dependent protein